MVAGRAALELLKTIREAVEEDRYELSIHADNRIEERGLMVWQIASALSDAKVLKARLDDRPWPSLLVSQILPDGTEVHAKWSYRSHDKMARLVTVYYPD